MYSSVVCYVLIISQKTVLCCPYMWSHMLGNIPCANGTLDLEEKGFKGVRVEVRPKVGIRREGEKEEGAEWNNYLLLLGKVPKGNFCNISQG